MPTWLKLVLLYGVVAWMLYWTFWTNSAEELWERSSKTSDKKQTILLIKLIVSALCIWAVWFSIPMIIDYSGWTPSADSNMEILAITVAILFYVAYVLFRAGLIHDLRESYRTRRGKAKENAENRR